jgi:hypothetical protein
MAATSSVVVVFPLVPVMATYGTAHRRAPSSSSLHTGNPRSAAHPITGACSGTPGLTTTSVAPSRCSGRWPPDRTSVTASSTERASGSSGPASLTQTSAP